MGFISGLGPDGRGALPRSARDLKGLGRAGRASIHNVTSLDRRLRAAGLKGIVGRVATWGVHEYARIVYKYRNISVLWRRVGKGDMRDYTPDAQKFCQ